MRTSTLAILLSLALLPPVVIAAKPEGAGHGNRPTTGTQTLFMNLTGMATDAKTGNAFEVTLNISGTVSQWTNRGNGNGKSFSGTGLLTCVTLMSVEDGPEPLVDSFQTTTAIHGSYASYLGQSLDGFRFNLQMRGADAKDADASFRLLHVGLHGNTTGVSTDEDTGEKTYATVADGQANVKVDDGAHNHQLATMGTSGFRSGAPATGCPEA